VPWPYDESDAAAFLALPQELLRPRFLIFLRACNRLVGGIGLHGGHDAELGYWIARAHWGRGIATEAGRAVVELADSSLRLPRLVASHALDNPASGHVLAKLGFSATGITTTMHSEGRGGDMRIRLFARDRRPMAMPESLAA
jgi:RimJ/RimL family protein N-acetyltransferase